jgi:hypothetical protein
VTEGNPLGRSSSAGVARAICEGDELLWLRFFAAEERKNGFYATFSKKAAKKKFTIEYSCQTPVLDLCYNISSTWHKGNP